MNSAGGATVEKPAEEPQNGQKESVDDGETEEAAATDDLELNEEQIDESIGDAADDAVELEAKQDEDEEDGDEVVDEVGEVDEVNDDEVPDFDASEDPSNVSLETSNVLDNDDSLNLTIGEDEKLFQDEVSGRLVRLFFFVW